jgi:hypothetical protein
MLSSRVQDQHFSFVRLVQLIQASHDIHYPFYKPREYLMFLVKTSNPTRRAHYHVSPPLPPHTPKSASSLHTNPKQSSTTAQLLPPICIKMRTFTITKWCHHSSTHTRVEACAAHAPQ